MTPLVVGLMFKALLNPDYGVLGYAFVEMGISGPHGLLADPHRGLAAPGSSCCTALRPASACRTACMSE